MNRNKRDGFEASNMIMFVLMMLANVLNYLFQIIMGRMLSVEEYSVVNTLLSIAAIFSIPCAVITLVVAKYIAAYKAVDDRENEKKFLNLLIKCTGMAGCMVLVAGITGSKVIASILKLNSPWYVIMPVAVAALTLILAPMRGIQQGIKDFWGYGIQNLVTTVVKLAGSIVLVYWGWSAKGVMGAMLIATVLTIGYCMWNLKKYIIALKQVHVSGKDAPDYLTLLKLLGYTLFVQLCINFMTNGDILIVKSLFDEYQAGLYSSAMVLGKIAMYVSGAVVGVMFPMVAELYAQGEPTRQLFIKANLYGGGMAILCSVGMILFGRPVIGTLFGKRYLESIDLLPAVCLFVVPVTFLTVISNYAIAVEKITMFTISLAIGLIGCVICALYMRGSILQLFMGIGVVLSVVVIVDIIYLIRNDKGRKANEK